MVILFIFEFFDLCLCIKVVLIDVVEVIMFVFQELIDNMFYIMYEVLGIGLVVSQVDVYKCFMVIDVSEEKDILWVFINFEIVVNEGGQVYQEGCLLVLGIFVDVICVNQIMVCFLDCQGVVQELIIDGVLVVCI